MAQFDLCPKCGAVSRDGLCQSCGYKIPGVYGVVKEEQNSFGDNTYQQSEGDNHQSSPQYYVPGQRPVWQNASNTTSSSSTVVALSVTFVVALILVFFGIIIGVYSSSKSKMVKEIGQISIEMPDIPEINSDYGTLSDDEWINIHGNYPGSLKETLSINESALAYFEWETLEDDPYDGIVPDEYEFDDYITTDVSYSVKNSYWLYTNEDGKYDSDEIIYPHTLTMYGNFFRLSDTGLENEDEVNSLIFERAMRAADVGENMIDNIYAEQASIEVYSQAYVTYMDSNLISIAFYVTGDFVYNAGTDDESRASLKSFIDSINIDLETGKEILASEVFDFGGDFVDTFTNRCLEQNGSPVDYFNRDSLISILTDDDTLFWVYTPLGLEVGVNRPDYIGWSTGTFVDYQSFFRIY